MDAASDSKVYRKEPVTQALMDDNVTGRRKDAS